MAGNESSEKPVFSLKLLVDKKKKKVVLAEACKDFVDVLFSLLTLPMGTIVRLLEKYQQNQKSQAVTIGCFNNLYRSVLDISNTASFMTEACKDMLLYPRSVKEKQRRQLKLNIDGIEVLKYYRCAVNSWPCTTVGVYSNFCSSKYRCGALMEKEFETRQGVGCSEIFYSDKTFFTITDNMRVEFTSTGHTLKTLKESGYTDVDQLHEMLVDVNHEKILALLQSLFSSDTPLTDVFLMKRSSCDITKAHNMPRLPIKEQNGGEDVLNKLISVSVFTRKLDKKVIYIESGKDFVDLLLTFLVLPLNSAWEITGSNMVLGCVGNLCESFKTLSSSKGRNTSTEKCMLPWYYSCQQPLLDVCYAQRDRDQLVEIGSLAYMYKSMDPRCNNYDQSTMCSGFVKGGATFTVLDDLTITPMNFSPFMYSLKKWNMGLDDIEEQVISISKAEAIRLLRASFITSTALIEHCFWELTRKETERRESLKPPLSRLNFN